MTITGDPDPVIPAFHAHAVHQAVLHSRLHIIAGVAHRLHTERTETVTALIDDFIGSGAEHANGVPAD